MKTDGKEINPKDIAGSGKLPLFLWPGSASAMGSLALLSGALKYGRNNWRATQVLASVYISALKRHTEGYFEGEDIDPDEGIPHLSGILANAAILVDAGAAGTLVDDRQFPGGYRGLIEELTPHVARLKALHAGKNPTHYTIRSGQDRRKAAEPDVLHVAVGAIIGLNGEQVFLQQRRFDDENFGGRWECPGGGVDPDDEDYVMALHRELHEELGVGASAQIDPTPIWEGRIEGYGNKKHVFHFYRVTLGEEPKALDGQPAMGWFHATQVNQLPLTPANLLAWPAIEKLLKKAHKK